MRYAKGVLCQIRGGGVNWVDCEKCEEKYKFRCFPPPLLEYLYTLAKEDGEELGDYTVTELLDCARKINIMKRDGFYINPENVYEAWKGLISHEIMAKWTKPIGETYIEQRFKVEYQGLTITFQPDRVDFNKDTGNVYDFKFVRDLPTFKKPYKHHALQLNLYKFFLNLLGKPIKNMYIIYMTTRAMDVYKIEELSGDTIQNLIYERVVLHKKNVPVLFNDQENWRCRYCEVLPTCVFELLKEGYNLNLKLK